MCWRDPTMHALSESKASLRDSSSRHCPVKQIHVDVSFCDHVCSFRDTCTYHAAQASHAPPRVDPLILLTTADLSQLTRLGVNPLQHKGNNLNRIQDRYLQDPLGTKRQVDALREIPWINHYPGCEWPTCNCLACCGALIISVIENASTRS
jgi:hypothetical protein